MSEHATLMRESGLAGDKITVEHVLVLSLSGSVSKMVDRWILPLSYALAQSFSVCLYGISTGCLLYGTAKVIEALKKTGDSTSED